MDKTCPFCHLKIAAGATWCIFCGKRLDARDAITTMPARPSPIASDTTSSSVTADPHDPQELIERGVCIGNFKLVKLLGAGGGGAVFLGEHQKIQRRVAIKVLKPGLESFPEVTERFKQEAAVLSKLRHPSIVEVYDCGVSEEVGLFLIMEYLEGCSLDQYRKKQQSLSPREAALIGWHILSALEAAHNAKIIHRDLKPQNIYMAEVGTQMIIKILDFGIAKVLDQKGDATMTQAGVILGTPAYMSPEQAAGKREIDHRADLYSFGVLLFEMVTGQRPFQSKSAPHLIAMHKTEAPPRPSTLAPSLPKSMERLILHCMEKDPEDRPSSAAIPKEILRQVLAQESPPILLGDPTIDPFRPLPSGLSSPARTNRGKVFLWCTAGLLMLMLLGFLWFAHLQAGVLLETSPAGATITTLQGELLGRTPLRLTLPEGGLEVRGVLEGFSEFRLFLGPSSPRHLMVPLPELTQK